jgi:hypothetical protein
MAVSIDGASLIRDLAIKLIVFCVAESPTRSNPSPHNAAKRSIESER